MSNFKKYPIKLMQPGDIWKWGREYRMVLKKEYTDCWHVTFLNINSNEIDVNEYNARCVFIDFRTILIRDGQTFDFNTIPDTVEE